MKAGRVLVGTPDHIMYYEGRARLVGTPGHIE
jgi:hypothetical protein